jgi:hypothetical protein
VAIHFLRIRGVVEEYSPRIEVMAHDRQKVSRQQVGAVIAPVVGGVHDSDVEVFEQ